MFTVFPRTRVGLAIQPDGICIVGVRENWKHGSIRNMIDRSLPPGLIVPSTNEANITDLDGFVTILKEVRRSLKLRKIVLSLPDGCASMGVFGFESFPVKERDRVPLLQWRFRHELNREVGDSRIECRVFHVPPHLQHHVTPVGRSAKITVSVLAVAMRRFILDQILSACEKAGFLTVSVGIGVLQLFDIARYQISHPANYHFVVLAPDSSTFIAIRCGIPVFIRSRPRRRPSGTYAEWLASLQFMQDQFPRTDDMPEEVPMYFVGDESDDACPEPYQGIKITRLPFDYSGKDGKSQSRSMARLYALASATAA